MTRLRIAALLCLACVGMTMLSACGGGNSTQISITLNTATGLTSMDETPLGAATNNAVKVIAAVGGDTAAAGVTWDFKKQSGCSGSGLTVGSCGTLTTIDAFNVTYTAPAINATTSVVITATSVTDTKTTKTITLSIVLPPVFATTECNPSGVLPCTLANGNNAVPYKQNFTFTGGVQPYTFTLLGTLPQCLKLNTAANSTTGTILGTPCGSGTSNFTIQITDSGGAAAVSQAFVITVAPPPPLSLTSGPLPPGTVDAAYSGSIGAQGGVAPLTWSITSGALPPGLNFNSATGQITGVPTDQSGGNPNFYPKTYNFSVSVHDSALPNPQPAGPTAFSITIQPLQPLQITTQGPNLADGTTATGYSASLNATGGVTCTSPLTAYAWSVVQGQLPAGLSLSSNANGTATISGTPIIAGTSTFTVQVSDCEVNPGNGNPAPATAQATFKIKVNAGASNNSLFSGSYAFLFTGFDDDGSVQLAGTLTANGTGTITTGSVDANRLSGVGLGGSIVAPGGATPPGSTYTVGSDGHGTMELTMTFGANSAIVADYDLELDGKGNIHFIQDYTTAATQDPKHTHGEGILKPVAGTVFSAASFSGNYAFEFPGYEATGTKLVALAGVIHSNGATLSPGTGDFNDNGTYSAQMPLSGSFGFVGGNQGIASFTFAPSGPQVTLDFKVFFVTPSDLFFIEGDSDAKTGLPTVFRLAGEAVLQSTNTAFDQSAMSGSSVASGTGVNSNGNASIFAGLLTSTLCNNTAVAALSYDENNGGTINGGGGSQIAFNGTCSITSNGRVGFASLGGSAATTRVAAAYLTGPGTGFVIGSDAAVTTGLIEQQTIPSFSAASFLDGYTLSAPFIAEVGVKNVIGQAVADGASALTGVVDEIDATGASSPNLAQPLSATFSNPAPNGRGTLVTNGTKPNGFPMDSVFYVVSAGSVRILSVDTSDTHPQLILLDH